MGKPRSATAPRSMLELKPRQRLLARKQLGQHFLLETGVVQKILSASELGPGDAVLEVGPGLGALTGQLVRSAKKVIAIEMDSRLAASLFESLDSPPNLSVIHADAREVDLAEVLDGEGDYKMVANLPYYSANPILRRFLEADTCRPSLMVVMLQKEVARSMVAEAGRMSLLAVATQLYGIPRIICDVPPQAFYPPPKVTSSVVRIDVRSRRAIEVDNVEEFFDVVRAGFFAPRKQLRNSLSLGLGISTDQTSYLLEMAGLDPRRRPGDLSLEEWGILYRAGKEGFNRGDQGLRQDKSDP